MSALLGEIIAARKSRAIEIDEASGRTGGGAHLPGRHAAEGRRMVARIGLGEIAVDVVQKDIKNVHLNLNPSQGKARISAPSVSLRFPSSAGSTLMSGIARATQGCSPVRHRKMGAAHGGVSSEYVPGGSRPNMSASMSASKSRYLLCDRLPRHD